MKNYFKYTLFLLLITGCQELKKAPKPDRLIPEAKMVNILVDLAKIDAAMTYNMRDFEKKGVDPKTYVYEKYGIDSAQLAKNNAYYIEDFKVNKRMYEEVRARLTKEKEQLDSLEAVQDSLRITQRKNGKDSLELKTFSPRKKYPAN